MPAETHERRRIPRTELKQMLRIRPFDPQFPPEYHTTVNVSRNGLYFETSAGHYSLGMSVYVTSDYEPESPINRDIAGAVVRVEKLGGDQFGIAIQLFSAG